MTFYNEEKKATDLDNKKSILWRWIMKCLNNLLIDLTGLRPILSDVLDVFWVRRQTSYKFTK